MRRATIRCLQSMPNSKNSKLRYPRWTKNLLTTILIKRLITKHRLQVRHPPKLWKSVKNHLNSIRE